MVLAPLHWPLIGLLFNRLLPQILLTPTRVVSHLEHCEAFKLGTHLLAFGQLLCVERQLSTVQLLIEYIFATFIVDEVRNILFMFIGLAIGTHHRDCDDLRDDAVCDYWSFRNFLLLKQLQIAALKI